MHVRSILTGILPLLLGGVLVTACDSKKEEPKTDDKKVTTAKVDEKVDEKKADELKADEAKADDAAVADGPADDAAADGKAPEDVKAADGGEPPEDAKAEDAKAEDVKADPDTKGEKKGEDKGEKKGEDKPDDKAEPAAAKIDGKKLYADKCASCHGSSGKADTKLGEKHKIPSWAEAGWKSKWSVSKVEDIVTKGKPDTKMKAFAGKLTPEEIKAVSKYAHGLGK